MAPTESDGNLSCGICLVYTSLKEGDYFCLSECGHLYHFECIRDWICQHLKNAPCPSCRQSITLKRLVRLRGFSPADNKPSSNKPKSMKFCIIGDSGCGKTSLLLQYARGKCDEVESTVGCDLYFKNVHLSGKMITLSIWDCGGQERYQAITPNYLRNSHGIFIVYDITNSETLENIRKTWLKLINDYAPDGVVQMLIGNKSDLESSRQVSKECGSAFANALGINFLETSAKENYNVEASFRLLVAGTLQNRLDEGFDLNDLHLSNDDVDDSRKSNQQRGCKC